MTNDEAVRVLASLRCGFDSRQTKAITALTLAIEALEREGDRPAHGEGE